MCNIKWPLEPIKYLGIYIGHDTEMCYKLNFEDKIKLLENTLKQAEKRNLSLFGKVCIIKSLALSKIVYTSMCLVIPDKVIKAIDQKIFQFLWGKRDRIKRKSIINSVENGGLNMIDLKSQIKAIKASWVGRIMTAPDGDFWSILPKLYFSKFGNDYLLLKTTFTQKSMFPQIDSIPAFYQDVVISYNSAKQIKYEEFVQNIKYQPIWGNRFVKLKNKTLYFKSWITEGIVAFENLKIANGKIDVEYIYNRLRDKRKFHSEINILQKALKLANIRISNTPTNDPVLNTRIPYYIYHQEKSYEWVCQKSKYYYKRILEDIVQIPSAERYWGNIVNLADGFISKSYVKKVKLIKDKKLSETNFKILNNILPCNRNLYKWGKRDTVLCDICQEEETISHLLYYCRYAQTVWSVINQVFGNEYGDISHDNVIFGVDLDMSLNYVISIVVYYIYRDWLVCSLENKVRKQRVSVKYFKNYLTHRQNVYMSCIHNVWNEVCAKLELIICAIENDFVDEHDNTVTL